MKQNTIEAQEAYQTSTIDEVGEFEVNKTTIEALKDGATKMGSMGASSMMSPKGKYPHEK